MQTHLFTPEEESAEAREDVAARLERLARLIRGNHHTYAIEVYEEAYRAVGRLAKELQDANLTIR